MSEAPTRGMLDTSTVILLGDIADPTTLPEESVISAITLAELSVGPHVARSYDERSARQQHLTAGRSRLRGSSVRRRLCASFRRGRRGTAGPNRARAVDLRAADSLPTRYLASARNRPADTCSSCVSCCQRSLRCGKHRRLMCGRRRAVIWQPRFQLTFTRGTGCALMMGTVA